KSQMADAIRQFGDTIKRGGVGLFYFAGHGVQVNGENFLIPVDDDIQEKSQVATKGIEAKLVLQAMSTAKNRLNVVILDACRNNPFAQNASRALVPTGNTDSRARSDSAGGRQVPWENTSLEGDFYFVPPSTSSVASLSSAGQSTTPAGGQQAALQPSRSDTPVAKPVRSPGGFSFSREEEKDRVTRFAKDDEIRARLQAPCPDALRQRPIIIDITEESHADGLIATDRSSRFAQLVNQNLQQAGLTTNLADPQGQPAGRAGRLMARAGRVPYPQGHYSIQGVVLSQQGATRV